MLYLPSWIISPYRESNSSHLTINRRGYCLFISLFWLLVVMYDWYLVTSSLCPFDISLFVIFQHISCLIQCSFLRCLYLGRWGNCWTVFIFRLFHRFNYTFAYRCNQSGCLECFIFPFPSPFFSLGFTSSGVTIAGLDRASFNCLCSSACLTFSTWSSFLHLFCVNVAFAMEYHDWALCHPSRQSHWTSRACLACKDSFPSSNSLATLSMSDQNSFRCINISILKINIINSSLSHSWQWV